ncbi:MAG: DNA repair protein RecO [Planctomycetes bacterium]|nr:DNA repair protein RecO [Planctomycetota bacterium]
MKAKTLAIPIRRLDFSDTSQIVTFFTREAGILEGIAKGAYREKSPFQGPFDLATLCEIVYVKPPLPQPTLRIIAEATQLEGYRGLRQRWDRHAAASFLLELLRAVNEPDDPAPRLFDLTASTLGRLGGAAGAASIADLLAAFELKMLRLLGLSAELEGCAECGRRWKPSDQPVFFCVEEAGILCRRCRAERPGRQGRMVPGGLVERFNAWSRVDSRSLPELAAAPPADPLVRKSMQEVLAQLLVFFLEREFRMLRYLS